MLPDPADNSNIQVVEDHLREYEITVAGLKKHRQILDIVLERTRNPEYPDIKDILPDLEDRSIRRNLTDVRNLLEEAGRKSQLPYLLSIEEGRPGYQSSDARRKRNTFYFKPNLSLPDFYTRKAWTHLFPNMPGGKKHRIRILSTLVRMGSRVLTSVGDLAIAEKLGAFFSRSGVEFSKGDIPTDDRLPNAPDTHLILAGNLQWNRLIGKVLYPESLQLRCDGNGGIGKYRDDREGDVRSVFALFSTFPCHYNKLARLSLFEASHDRALEALAGFMSDEDRLKELAKSLYIDAGGEYPQRLQLVFRAFVDQSDQLLGPNGGIELVHSSYYGTQRKPQNVVAFKAPADPKRSAS
jgi:hypothetical protein